MTEPRQRSSPGPRIVIFLIVTLAAYAIHFFTVTRIAAWQPGYPGIVVFGVLTPPSLMRQLHFFGPAVLTLAFIVFAVASLAQLVVGSMLDRFGPRIVFLMAATVQIVFFALMPGLREGWAIAVALGFMLGAFGQIPINDFMIGKMASGPSRARVYGVRYVVSFTALAAALPLISYVYGAHGFDTLFRLMAVSAAIIFAATACLPARLPQPQVSAG